jgi:enoyl-CoA hydratase/carnithine racemase
MHVRDEGSVRILTFDRPEKLNALDAGLADRAASALREADADPSVGAVVLTGTGRAYCAGVDLDHLTAIHEGTESSHHTIDFNQTLRGMDTPVIAAVNGLAVGVGTTMCLHVDLVVAGESARFRTPFASIGVAPEIGSSWLLPQQVGHQRAAFMLLSADWIDATTASDWGLVFEVVPDSWLLERAVAIGTSIAENDPAAVAAAKRVVRSWRAPMIETAEAVENAEFQVLLQARSGRIGR